MGSKFLTAFILSLMLAQGVLAQDEDGIPELDVVESDDLNQLLNDADKPATETASGMPLTDSTTTASSDESSLPPAEAGESMETAPITGDTPVATPVDTSSESLADAVKEADPALPQPLPQAGDDLDELKADLRDTDLGADKVATPDTKVSPLDATSESQGLTGPSIKNPVVNDSVNVKKTADNFDVGREERNLLELASSVQGQISNAEWNELATQAKVSSYTVVKDDWLFKISKRLFGSGFYYPKIWALNQFITNPHLIEPGMVLSFTTGSGDRAPEIKLGDFTPTELKVEPGANAVELAAAAGGDDFSVWGDEAKPEWLIERKNLVDQGVFVQYATSDTLQDLEDASRVALVKEYENYEPPQNPIENLAIASSQYDQNGFDKSSRISYRIKEGFYLNTFVTNNPVQDFGKVDSGPDENTYFTLNNRMYVTFDDSVNVLPGDRFSVYAAEGKVKHSNSDREGFRYTIRGQIRILSKLNDEKWEAEVEEVSGMIQRHDRITVYTPRIERITRTYNNRLIEAAVIGSYGDTQQALSFGDVIYIDRGRADGVEMGNVFEMYGFKDRLNGRTIANQPSYKMGELTVITLTDNFATCLVTNSIRDFYKGDIAITKTKEAALRADQARRAKNSGGAVIEDKALEELDVELKVEDLNDSLLDKADKIQLTEDELAELERQEREKSIIKDSERDLKALERLENEIEGAEKLLREAKLDEDKLLEGESLEEVERKRGVDQQEGLDEIEENLGKRYMDEDLNSKENPYGLTEFDIEEVDELLNTEKQQGQ